MAPTVGIKLSELLVEVTGMALSATEPRMTLGLLGKDRRLWSR